MCLSTAQEECPESGEQGSYAMFVKCRVLSIGADAGLGLAGARKHFWSCPGCAGGAASRPILLHPTPCQVSFTLFIVKA